MSDRPIPKDQSRLSDKDSMMTYIWPIETKESDSLDRPVSHQILVNRDLSLVDDVPVPGLEDHSRDRLELELQ